MSGLPGPGSAQLGAGDIPRSSVLRWRACLLAPNRDPGDDLAVGGWRLAANGTLRKSSVTVTQRLGEQRPVVWNAQRARQLIRFFWVRFPADDRLPG